MIDGSQIDALLFQKYPFQPSSITFNLAFNLPYIATGPFACYIMFEFN